jgi:predicted ATPase/transcriptional regulator with XRE-family HTH domain
MSGAETYSFGEWLKQRRERLRMTQREVAAGAHCSPAMIKKVEADERQPSPELAELLASALHVPEADHGLFIQVARGERPVDLLWQVQAETTTSSAPYYAPAPLPSAATPFVGRTVELAQLSERLAHPNCRLLTLSGPGGVGKTRLALAAAQAQRAAFGDGVAFVSLAAISDAALIPDAVARSLRLTLTGPAAEQVLAYLRRRNMLLILDNCEQLVVNLTWLSDLLAHAPGVRVLATSRERLHLVEEWIYLVPELAEAAALFVETARRLKQDFDAVGQQAAVARICQQVGNLPLAVELAASWTPLMPCAQIADHIQGDINILAADVRNAPARHRSVQAVFDHSWNLLTSAEQNALMRLSVFRGGWQAAEALAVADADLFLIRRLVDKSVVRSGENGRYDLHELIRQYAAQKLVQSGCENETRRRHFDAYLALAAQLDDQHFRPQGLAALARFDQEQENIRAALAWSLDEGRTESSLRLLSHLWIYWFRRGYYHEAGEWTIRAIDQAGERESVPLSIALCNASFFLFIQGRFGEGELLAHRAVAMARRFEDPEALIEAYATYTFTSANLEQALDGLHAGIALIEETGKMQHSLPMFYLGAATWLHSGGRYAEAGDYYRKSIALHRQMGAVDMTADPLGRLGQLALQEGRIEEAYALTVESIGAAHAAGYDVGFGAWGGARLGLILLYLGELEAAQRSLEEALLLFDDSQHARVKLEALAILSEVMLARGDVTGAAEHLQASLSICRMLYRRLEATEMLEGTVDASPIDLIGLCARASLVAAAQGHDGRAVTLCSIADSFRSQSGQVMIQPLQARLDETLATIRAYLSESAFDFAWNAGRRISLAEAFSYLLS